MGFDNTAVAADTTWHYIAQNLVMEAGIIDETTEEALFRALASTPRARFLSGVGKDPRKPLAAVMEGGLCSICRLPVAVRLISLCNPARGKRILTLGAGDGYLPALVSKMGAESFAVESNGPLAQGARKNLDALGFQNVILHRGDLMKGWEEHAPYDAILILRPMDHDEPELLRQVELDGGKIVSLLSDGFSSHRVVVKERLDEKTRFVRFEAVSPCDT